jgi:hypothetical protein
MKKHHHYVEVVVERPNRSKATTRLPFNDWEESKRAAGLIAAEFFACDEGAMNVFANGYLSYQNINDCGDSVTIRPTITTEALAIGEAMKD